MYKCIPSPNFFKNFKMGYFETLLLHKYLLYALDLFSSLDFFVLDSYIMRRRFEHIVPERPEVETSSVHGSGPHCSYLAVRYCRAYKGKREGNRFFLYYCTYYIIVFLLSCAYM